jgi:Family of unknown function (DUF6152)
MVGFRQMRHAPIALLAWCLCQMSVLAHHSTLAYDGTQPTVISGVVAAFNWRYPHTSITLDVSESGGAGEAGEAGEPGEPGEIVTRWTVESESLQMLSRLGWTKNSIRPGDRIRVTGARARNGDFAMRCRTIDLPDGRTLSCFPTEEGP